MIDWFKSLFQKHPEQQSVSVTQQVRIAAVALMYEVMRADSEHKQEEIDALVAKLMQRWQLDDDSARALLDAARTQAEQAVDYHKLVTLLREHYNAEQRAALVLDMWNIAHADGVIDPMEEFIIRKVADLLYVPHSTFIYGKLHGQTR